jgi:RimJ/RimL family protein N-acetyltransferase
VAATAQFIGFTGLNPMPYGVPGAGGMEVGWRLAHRAWHHGYATEAAAAAVDVGFNGVGLSQIWSMTAVANLPSQAVMRRIGMTPYARFDHPNINAGHPLRPHIVYRLQGATATQDERCSD